MAHRYAHRRAAALSIVLAVQSCAFAPACSDGLPAYNEIDSLRVLALQAEPPELVQGESASLRALVADPDGRDPDFVWSWCPMTAGGTEGFACLVDAEQLAAAWQEAGGEDDPPPLDLGVEPEATFENPESPGVWRALCRLLAEQSAPVGVAPPRCDRALESTVRLVVTADAERVEAVKRLPLPFDTEAPRNENPVPEALRVEDAEGANVADDALALGRGYTLMAEIPEQAAELFTPPPVPGVALQPERRETLFATWFVTHGETDAQRTTFIDGELSFDELLENPWELPANVNTDAGQLWLVVRDERGGTGWVARDVTFAVPADAGQEAL